MLEQVRTPTEEQVRLTQSGGKRRAQLTFGTLEFLLSDAIGVGQGGAPPSHEGPDEVPCFSPVRYAVVYRGSCIEVAHHALDRTRSAEVPGNDHTVLWRDLARDGSPCWSAALGRPGQAQR
ncbi:hypothetical protein GCM10010286_31330 [Streptomyces toxytricini]|nr:hypothetical protein GCM10010286_31330 [Streptomyces toxytricini]